MLDARPSANFVEVNHAEASHREVTHEVPMTFIIDSGCTDNLANDEDAFEPDSVVHHRTPVSNSVIVSEPLGDIVHMELRDLEPSAW